MPRLLSPKVKATEAKRHGRIPASEDADGSDNDKGDNGVDSRIHVVDDGGQRAKDAAAGSRRLNHAQAAQRRPAAGTPSQPESPTCVIGLPRLPAGSRMATTNAIIAISGRPRNGMERFAKVIAKVERQGNEQRHNAGSAARHVLRGRLRGLCHRALNATVTTSNTGRPSTSSGRDSPAKALLRKTIVMME